MAIVSVFKAFDDSLLGFTSISKPADQMIVLTRMACAGSGGHILSVFCSLLRLACLANLESQP